MPFLKAVLVPLLAFCCLPVVAQNSSAKPDGPTDPRAQKSFEEGLALEAKHHETFALDSFKKADKQDGNHCAACAEKVVTLATAEGDYKLANAAALELIALAETPKAQVAAYVSRAEVLMAEGKNKKKPEAFADGEKELDAAIALDPANLHACFLKGVCLADQQQDDAARQVFAALQPKLKAGSVDYGRVSRYAERPELVRARLAPPFSVTTLDGKRVSMDDLKDKVVLLDFWATWCGPCREALPHVRRIAQQFEGQPLVVLSVSLDADANDAKWKDFIARNGMTWLQYRDGGFDGRMARMFNVNAIPHTFTIDSDGVMQDEHVGDANIEGKLKKLVAEAKRRQEVPRTMAAAESR
jgi:thiol-disulfide isomerase/thioredoxin